MRLVLVVLVLVACTTSAPPAAPEETVSTTAALVSHPALVLDVDDRGRVLAGTPLPVPPDADARLLVTLSVGPATVPGVFRDASFFPGDPHRLVAVDRAGVLHVLDLRDGGTLRLDAPVEAGFDVSPECGCVAYMRGEDTEVVLVRAPLAGGAPQVVAEDVAPAWLPVLSPQGDRVAFASGRSGFGALWVVPLAGGAATQLTNVGASSVEGLVPFPEGPSRPVWAGRTLLFANGDETHALDESGRLLWTRRGLGDPRWHARGRTLAFGDGSARPLDEALRRAAP